MLAAIERIGRDRRTGGYRRFAWNDADMELREWFADEAAARGMAYEEDGNGNQVAWLGAGASGGDGASGGEGADALLLGSHLDSVPDGGAYDGPLGVVSSFAALDQLRRDGFVPSRPIAVACFADEEGARFGVACAGSRLAAGTLAPEKALALTDVDGCTLAEVMRARGRDPRRVGRSAWLDRVGAFVELHVEQGRALVHSGDAVGVATAIWPHGRWRLDFSGRADHAGTTPMEDRRDPMPAYAATVVAATARAVDAQARATFGRVVVEPGGANAVPSRVSGWLDARAPDDGALARLIDTVLVDARAAAAQARVGLGVTVESASPAVGFDTALRERLAAVLAAPSLPTGAGHDAGVLSRVVPTAMLFVRNPTGVSHSPDEHADDADCAAGVDALATVVRELA
ncbi:allantoate amidohydrolase [Mumia sp.]|uniref:allantoate amidohydrolase n=1 Tax=Mumia sp. TaxID=1965300 RepID=UPI00260CDE07|nr:allantoate amidohydrolase [Mumia sp.]MDD9348243.1 allantoate amidohydrolase [Mumia sp.]